MGKSAGSKSVMLCSALLLMHGYGLSSLPSTFSFHPLTPRCKLHVFCCPPPFSVISFSYCRITRSSSSSSQLQLLPFEFRYTFPNINIVAATIHQACRVVSPFRIWRLVVPDLSSTSETSVYCSASWDYWATRKFMTGEREVVGDLTRGNKLLEEEEELWSQVSG